VFEAKEEVLQRRLLRRRGAGFPWKTPRNPVLSNLSQRRLLVTLETPLRVRLLHLFTPDNRLNAPCENERGQLTAAEAFGTVIEWKL
jgi:hypothetical protein